MISPRTALSLLALSAPALLGGGCLSLPSAAPGSRDGAEGARLGHFEVASSFGPAARIAPTACSSGDPERFLGVDLEDASSRLVVRLVIDPLFGPAVRVFDSEDRFERSVVFFRDDCETFTFTLAPTGWIINEVHVRRVALELDCATEEGSRIAGRAAADRCD